MATTRTAHYQNFSDAEHILSRVKEAFPLTYAERKEEFVEEVYGTGDRSLFAELVQDGTLLSIEEELREEAQEYGDLDTYFDHLEDTEADTGRGYARVARIARNTGVALLVTSLLAGGAAAMPVSGAQYDPGTIDIGAADEPVIHENTQRDGTHISYVNGTVAGFAGITDDVGPAEPLPGELREWVPGEDIEVENEDGSHEHVGTMVKIPFGMAWMHNKLDVLVEYEMMERNGTHLKDVNMYMVDKHGGILMEKTGWDNDGKMTYSRQDVPTGKIYYIVLTGNGAPTDFNATVEYGPDNHTHGGEHLGKFEDYEDGAPRAPQPSFFDQLIQNVDGVIETTERFLKDALT